MKCLPYLAFNFVAHHLQVHPFVMSWGFILLIGEGMSNSNLIQSWNRFKVCHYLSIASMITALE